MLKTIQEICCKPPKDSSMEPNLVDRQVRSVSWSIVLKAADRLRRFRAIGIPLDNDKCISF